MNKALSINQIPMKISELLFGREESAEGKARGKTASLPARPQEQESVHAGHLQFLNVANLRRKFGEAWQSHAATIHQIANKTIAARIGEHDRFRRIEEDNYVIIFRGRSDEEATALSRDIAAEIERKVLSRNFRYKDFSVRSTVQPAVTDDEIKRLLRVVPPMLEAETSTTGAAARAYDALPGAPGAGAAVAPEEPSVPENAAAVDWAFCPIWSVHTSMIATYRLIERTPAEEQAGAGTDAPAPDPASLDLSCLDMARRIIADSGDVPPPHYLCVPIRYESTGDPAFRQEFARLFKAIPPAGRGRLVVELLDVPGEASREAIRRLAFGLRTLCKAVVGSIRPPNFELERFAKTGIAVVRADVGDLGENENRIIANVNRLVAEAEQYNLQTYISGVNTLSLLAGAVSAGAVYLSGGILGHPEDRPHEAFPEHVASIYGRRLTDVIVR